MRKYIKNILGILLLPAVLCSAAILSSCKSQTEKAEKEIVCTAFAQYDFTINILGEKAKDFEVTYLLESGVDMHSYSNSVSVADKVKILSCELFITVGGVSEKWVDEIVRSSSEEINVLRLSDHVGELVCAEDESGTQHAHGHSHDFDEHIWLSPKRALLMCDAICDSICEIDPENGDFYKKNCSEYKEKLEKLDKSYKSVFESARIAHLVFADRFPFVYMTHDYGVSYSAAFEGCSTETGATYETVAMLARDINENNIKALITLEKSTVNITETVINTAKRDDITVLRVISMQNVSKKDIDGGLSYLSAMETNLEIFGKAMN